MDHGTFEYVTVTTTLDKTSEPYLRVRTLGYRDEDLRGYGRMGYELTSTITVETAQDVQIVDTFKRTTITQ